LLLFNSEEEIDGRPAGGNDQRIQGSQSVKAEQRRQWSKKSETEGLRIPEDIAVIGCGNLHYDDSLRVPLSSIDQHSRRIGEEAARVALGILNSKAPPKPEKVVLRPELIVRRSTQRRAAKQASSKARPRP
jgi:hypothetical protein